MINSSNQKSNMVSLTFIPLAIAINVGVGAIVKALNLPLYLDSIGTIIATILLGFKKGAIVGVLSFILSTIIINPFAIYFCSTQLIIAWFINIVAKKGMFSNIYKTLFSGIGLGIVTAIVSAPIIVYLFQGATGNGASLVTSFFLKMGNQILNSVLLTGFSIEPLDKLIQCILSYIIIKEIPKSLLKNFVGGTLKENNFLN